MTHHTDYYSHENPPYTARHTESTEVRDARTKGQFPLVLVQESIQRSY